MKAGKFFSLMLAAMILALLPGASAEETEAPKIYITYAPAYGERAPVAGVVKGGPPENYRVSLYLQLEEGQQCWVKPYAESGDFHSYAGIAGDGSFSVTYATGGSDPSAKILHLMIVPGDYIPGGDFSATRAAALDYIRIDRTPEGDVSFPEDRRLPSGADEGAGPEITGKPSGLSVSAEYLAVNVGPYTSGNSPDRGDPVREEDVRAQLEALRPYTDTVRFYAADGLREACVIAREMGFSIICNAWLSGNKEADQKELDALIDNCNAGLCDMAVVGSETLLRGDLTPAELIAYIGYVKAGITDERIAVTTADSAYFFLADSELTGACDVLFVNVYPFWDGIAIGDAPAAFAGAMDQLRARWPGREIICSETGWPTAGGAVRDAVPGEEAAAAYFTAVREWSLREGVLIVYFDGADEPWKASAEGDVGAHWGFMTKDMVLKQGYREAEFFASRQE